MMEPFAQTARVVKKLRASYTSFQKALSEVVAQKFRDLPNPLRKVVTYLFQRGWYVGPDLTLPEVKYLAELINEHEHERIEAEIQQWAESRVDHILANVKKDFADRLAIISDAVEAHTNGKYTLSVPILLAQADGISQQSIGAYLFRGNPPKKMAKYFVELGSILDVLVLPLRSYSTLGKRTAAPLAGSESGHVNRHEVLHGTDTEYPTKANSLRALLLVDYVLGVMQKLVSHEQCLTKWWKELEEVMAATEKTPSPTESGSVDGEKS